MERRSGWPPPELTAAGYALLEKLGAGTGAEVWLASKGAAKVAVKIATGGGAVDREAALLARIERQWGPRLVERGPGWFAMEWIEGARLDPRASSGAALVVAHGVARGLDELHRAGIRHGDVKPANIIVSERGATLVDLDLASAVADDALRGGTPRYLAPEQRAGQPSTPAADVYALGLVLAEIAHPELASAPSLDGVADVLGSDELDTWIAAAIAKAPGARPSAAFIASQAARALGLPRDAGARDEIVARRIRIRNTRRASEPLDALGVARWLVALIGPDAVHWPMPPAEGLEARLEALAATAPPEAWTLDEVWGRAARGREAGPRGHGPALWVELASELAKPRPSAAAIDAAEEEAAAAPASLGEELARALLRRGDTGRAFAVLARRSEDEGPETTLLRAEIARRRGDVEAAAALAGRVDDPRARALVARLAWDRGDLAAAESLLGDAAGAAATEVRALVAYARGEHERGLALLDALAGESGLVQARLDATRGMLEHARGRARASVAAFARAVERASEAGAIVEEATYLTGLAAAAVDAGSAASALSSSTRAALLWERLDRPALAARAHLSRAAAFALVGAAHEAERAAAEPRRFAATDPRAAAYARWAVVEARAPTDPRAAAEAAAAASELAASTDDDRVRAAARVLATGGNVDVAAMDALPASAAARWEWWGARAATSSEARPLTEILALLDVPAPLGSRGPALAAAARLAKARGDGEATRRIENARRAAALVLREGAPPEHRAALGGVAWLEGIADDDERAALGAAQVGELESIVRALSARDRLKPLLEQVLDTMVLWTGVERGLLLLRAPDGRLVPRAARNLARKDLAGEQLTLSTSLAQRAIDSRSAVLATDAFTQIGDLHASVHALGLRSVLAVPLVARGDVLGVVYLDDRVRRGAFGPSELAWVRLVASQAALAIADARDQTLLRRAVRRAERANARLEAELGAREVELASARAELSATSETRYRYDEIAGRSEPMRAMLKLVDRVTASDVPVLLSGESGTGKELVARAIHANGPRSARPFVSENCGSVPVSLLESTLFGHVRGAFTGASATRAGLFDVADRGTLFLDEIGEMPLAMQTKLLRVLQNGEVRPVGGERSRTVDVRIIGATHRDLEAMVAAGTFREDLFYRLNVVTLRVPPLRERREDIPLLAARFVQQYAGGKKVKVTRAAIDRLSAFPWPGNVRQLENEIRRALVLADDRIDVTELSDEVARGGPSATRDAGVGLKARVDALETELVKDALVKTKGNQTRAAEVLGVSRFGLQKMMRRLGIKPA